MTLAHTSNFAFLKEHDTIFFELANMAEQSFASDPNTTLIKLRQLAEAFAKDIAGRCNIYFDDQTSQVDLIHQIDRELHLDPTVRNLFHTLRVEGNKATHEFKTEHKEALKGLKLARSLAVWYHQSFGKVASKFNPGGFIAPSDPSKKLSELQQQINQLRAKNQQLTDNQELITLLNKEKQEYTTLAEQMDKEAKILATQVAQQEQTLTEQRQLFEEHIRLLQLELAEQIAKDPQHLAKQQLLISQQIKAANKQIFLDEELARLLIDQQLIAAGWQADSLELTWDNGARPEPNKNKAIGSYPIISKGIAAYADYILFCGLMPVAIIEAKSDNINVAAKLNQAESYAQHFKLEPLMLPPWQQAGINGGWCYSKDKNYLIPFIYSSNGRPYNEQIEEKSGIWFRDVRSASNLAMALQHFHTPAGLMEKLAHDTSSAAAELQQTSFTELNLRDYQQKAITAIELALQNNQRNCLVAMATGTGKTIVINALAYRFLKSNRFKHILILVDDTVLSLYNQHKITQTITEQQAYLATLYNLAELNNALGNLQGRLHIATTQSMLARLADADPTLPIDTFDCILIDETQSAYLFEQDLLEADWVGKNTPQYIAEYNQLLNYFDAVKIALTTTPIKHTIALFGAPLYSYSYREAVADDYLIDYEPPIRYETLLTQQGITFHKNEQVKLINASTGNIESTELNSELTIDNHTFNCSVINKSFNQIICQELSHELNPFDQQKTLIFCSSDLHADMVKNLLDKAFTELYGNIYDQSAVAKITTTSYNPEQLIANFKHSHYPTIAVTVDLLTTGIIIPTICNLVFLRQVKSPILFEQMLGRATSRCDDIGKNVFRIYDPVGVYPLLADVLTIKPLTLQNTLANLISQFTDEKQLKEALVKASNILPDKKLADEQLEQIIQLVAQITRKAAYQAKTEPFIEKQLNLLAASWTVNPINLPMHLKQLGPRKAADFIKHRKNFINELAELKQHSRASSYQIISEHLDKLLKRTQQYGKYDSAIAFLNAFKIFIKQQIAESDLFTTVLTTPNSITKDQLRAIRLLLDTSGYSETALQTAWRNQYHQLVDAGLLGYIRHAALDEPLIPFTDRVDIALQKAHALYPWTSIQRQWLGRLAEHLIFKEVLDKNSLNNRLTKHYASSITQLDKLLAGQLTLVIETLTQLWPTVAETQTTKTQQPSEIASTNDAKSEQSLHLPESLGLLQSIKKWLGIK